jgi:hypothetical protein
MFQGANKQVAEMITAVFGGIPFTPILAGEFLQASVKIISDDVPIRSRVRMLPELFFSLTEIISVTDSHRG